MKGRVRETEQMLSIKSFNYASPPVLEWQLANNRLGSSIPTSTAFQILSGMSDSCEKLRELKEQHQNPLVRAAWKDRESNC